jgi:hypothetical protein
MTDNNDIESLKVELKSLFELVKTNAEAKVGVEREELFTKIASLSAELNQDFKPEDHKETSLESLRYKAGVLQDVIGALKAKSETGDLAGLVTRGDPSLTELSAEQLEDAILDLIQLAFGLEPADDEIKALMRLEREVEGYTLRRS